MSLGVKEEGVRVQHSVDAILIFLFYLSATPKVEISRVHYLRRRKSCTLFYKPESVLYATQKPPK